MEDALRKLVAVKPLEWEPFWNQDNGPRETAPTEFGYAYHADEDRWWVFLGRSGEVSDMEAAKSSAQADYEARIFAALEPV